MNYDVNVGFSYDVLNFYLQATNSTNILSFVWITKQLIPVIDNFNHQNCSLLIKLSYCEQQLFVIYLIWRLGTLL